MSKRVTVAASLLAGGFVVVLLARFSATSKFEGYRRDTAKVDAREIHPYAEHYRHEHPKEPCPTIDLLVRAGGEERRDQDAARTDAEISRVLPRLDSWNTPFEIECRGIDVSIVSFGPDRTKGTDDDIRVP